MALSLAEADVLSGLAYPFGNDGIFSVLTTGTPPDQYLLQFVLAVRLQAESKYVVL